MSKSKHISFLFIGFLILTIIGTSSFYYIYNSDGKTRYYLWTFIGFGWGILYTILLILGKKFQYSMTQTGKFILLFSILIIHFIAWKSQPIWEDDYFRYAWDGKMIRHGIHPYSESPEIAWRTLEKKNLPVPEYHNKINFPEYRTVYPPITELLFASERLAPDTTNGWMFMILFLDFFAVIMLWLFCRHKDKPMIWLVFVALVCHPIWLKEGLNSVHFDLAVIIPLAAFIFIREGLNKPKSLLTPLFLGLTAGIRPWFLALILWAGKEWRWKEWSLFVFVLFAPWVIMISLPGMPSDILEGLKSWSEFVKDWEFNSIIYDIVRRGFGFENARTIVWILGLGAIVVMRIITWKKDNNLFAAFLGLIFWMICQPTANAWYFLPMLAGVACLIFNKNIPYHKVAPVLAASAIVLPLAYFHYGHIENIQIIYKDDLRLPLWFSVLKLTLAFGIAYFVYFLTRPSKEKTIITKP